MNIKSCKKEMVLPKKGTPVRTIIIHTDSEMLGTFASNNQIRNRKEANGNYLGFVPSTGGDAWLVEHDPGEVAVYMFDEVFDR